MSNNAEPSRPAWDDATAAALGLTPTKRALLTLLAQLPLASAGLLLRLYPAVATWTVHRSLNELRDDGLIAAVHAPLVARRAARLWHLSDLGVAAIALDQGADPAALARANGLGRDHLLTDLRHLPAILALHRLLGALAAARPGAPRLVAWQRPWRGTYPRPHEGAHGVVRLPARAALAWGAGDEARRGDFLLLADRATAPLRDDWREPLAGLFPYNAAERRAGRTPPTLLIATGADRVPTWRAMLDDLRTERREVPLPAHVATWETSDADIASFLAALRLERNPWWLSGAVPVARPTLTVSEEPMPRLVGGPLAGAAAAMAVPAGPHPTDCVEEARGMQDRDRPARRESAVPLALSLSASEWALLDLIARHPLLTRDQAARALGWGDDAVRRRRGALLDRGLVRLIGADELGPRRAVAGRAVAALATFASGVTTLGALPGTPTGAGRLWRASLALLLLPPLAALALAHAGIGRARQRDDYRAQLAARQPVEATRAGLAAVAAWQGLTLPAAVDRNGLAGGGPDDPLGARTGLLAAPRHTLGVNELFATLSGWIAKAARTGESVALAEWRNAAACARKRLRPDGYCVVRRGERAQAFLLEYDRGTMGRRDWSQKLAAYHWYRDSGAYRRDYDGFPTLLVVVGTGAPTGTGEAARAAATEDRIARLLRDAATGRAPLSALLTTEARLAADPRGPLGSVWRTPETAASRRPLPP